VKTRFGAFALLLPLLFGAHTAAAAERRCGWLENPTPANLWLLDREAEWLLSAQGGYEAQGIDNLRDMTTRANG
jgi:hypothetical protein